MTFGEKLRQLRQAKGVTQTEVADAIGISKISYINYEKHGKYPRTRARYQALADYFNVDRNYLLTENENFILGAGKAYGPRGAKQAMALTNELVGMFAGGELSDEDREAVLHTLQDAYWKAKEINRKKYGKKNAAAKE